MTKEELKKEAQEQANRCTPLYPECFIQGYIASAGSREKRIEELEQELAVEKDLLQEETNLHLHAEDYIKSLEQKLEQTEKEMKAQITQAHIDGYNRGYAKAKEKIADIKANCDLAIEGRDVKIMELENENANLKSIAEFQQSSNMKRGFEIQKLEKENKLLGKRCNQLLKDKGNLTDELAKWKDEWQEQVQKANNEGWERTQQTLQLTKAKEIIKDLLKLPFANNEEVYADVGSHLDRAEQFLKEIEK